MSSKRSFKLMGILWIVVVSVGLVGVVMTYAIDNEKGDKPMDTELLGGMTTLMPEGLAEMQQGQYILHARGGKLTKVAVEKSLLPHDPKGHVQAISMSMALGPDGTVYVKQQTLICESKDGGRTWTSYELGSGPAGESMGGSVEILSDGTFISCTGGARSDSIPEWAYLDVVVCASSDEGRTWQKISEIKQPEEYHDWYVYPNYRFFRLPDDTLLCGISIRKGMVWDEHREKGLMYRSSDRGRTWQGPVEVCEYWGGMEGGLARTASGKLLAVIRYQRPLLPDDPPDLLEKTGASMFGDNYPYKHVFLADSEDEGLTWKNFRQLTTIFGQCYGYPAALSDGTVVVIHDHRYPRGLPGRAMISCDEGETWEDEVYYMYCGAAVSGYSQSVVLEDDLILTIAGTTEYMPATNSFHAMIGRSNLTAIRWQPVRD